MNKFQASILVYALINIAMGIHGYVGKHSIPSLAGGVTIGLIEIFFATYSKTNPRVGFIGAAVVSLLTGGMWLGRLFNPTTHELVTYPALVGMVLSFLLTLFLVGGHFLAKAKSKAQQA